MANIHRLFSRSITSQILYPEHEGKIKWKLLEEHLGAGPPCRAGGGIPWNPGKDFRRGKGGELDEFGSATGIRTPV
jgi:hypothetical protein